MIYADGRVQNDLKGCKSTDARNEREVGYETFHGAAIHRNGRSRMFHL